MAVIDDDWNYRIDVVKNESAREFESRVNELREEIIKLVGFKVQEYSTEISPNYDADLKILIERNKQLRNDIDKKLMEVSKQKNQYEGYKQDQKLLSQEIKDTHEAFLMAKKYYKRNLKIYYTIESENNEQQTIYIQFFTEIKKESESYSVRFRKIKKTEHYELLETNPKIKSFEELKKSLQETNFVPAILCSIRQSFLKMKKHKEIIKSANDD